jgi:hypothetical protein
VLDVRQELRKQSGQYAAPDERQGAASAGPDEHSGAVVVVAQQIQLDGRPATIAARPLLALAHELLRMRRPRQVR